MSTYASQAADPNLLFLTGPLHPDDVWFSWDAEEPAGEKPGEGGRGPRSSAWPAGKRLLIRDIVLLRLLELEERGEELGAAREELASYMRVARPRVSQVAMVLESEGLILAVSKRPGGHGRVRKISKLTPEGRKVAEGTRSWVLDAVVIWEGVAASVVTHLSRSGRRSSLTEVLRGAKFAEESSDQRPDGEEG